MSTSTYEKTVGLKKPHLIILVDELKYEDRRDALRSAKGIQNAILISIPMWAVLALVARVIYSVFLS